MGSVRGPLFALTMAKAKILVRVPATDVPMGPSLCLFRSLALGSVKHIEFACADSPAPSSVCN